MQGPHPQPLPWLAHPTPSGLPRGIAAYTFHLPACSLQPTTHRGGAGGGGCRSSAFLLEGQANSGCRSRS